MSTQSVADQLVEFCRTGQFDKAMSELYGDNITSQEMPGLPNEKVNGLPAVMQKSQQWMEGVEEMHGCEVSDPLVAGDYFSIRMMLDVTFKGAPRRQVEEICVYGVTDDKISSEQFFYAM